MKHHAILIVIVLTSLSAPLAQAADPPAGSGQLVTREAVDNHIAGRVRMLWSQVNSEGHWDNSAQGKKQSNVAGGKTALVLMGLKAAGEDEQDAKFQKALAALDRYDGDHTYTRAMRAQLWSMLKDSAYRAKLLKEGDWFLKAVRADGMYSYGPPEGAQEDSHGGDFSNTQYGILGMWACSDAGYEVPWKYWQLVEKNYLRNQARDGGWNYHGEKDGRPAKGYGSMTAGGVATLFVIWEKLYVAADRNCTGRVNPDLVKAVNAGAEWLSRNFDVTTNPGASDWRAGYVFYWFYGIERVGVASGLKYFGKHDWYQEIATAILSGKVAPHPDYTRGMSPYGWELMTLCYGRAPIAVNKLKYKGTWNEHPREYAMLCRWLARLYEEHFNWQIMPIEAPADELHDGPILSISGKGGFRFSKEEVDKLRGFVNRGGLIFAEAIDNARPFTDSVGALCKQLFPNLEMVALDKDHPIYSSHFRLEGKPELMGLKDGVRTLVVLSPKELSCDWQRLNISGGEENFRFGANLVQYASDGGQLWSKEESYWPRDRGAKPGKTVTIGRLIHGGTDATHVWDPTGSAGWQRIDILSRNAGGPAVVTQSTDLSQPLDPKAVPILHVTGIGELKLSAEARTNLDRYVAGGGMLLADAAGGSPVFTENFPKLAAEVFKMGALKPVPQLDWLKDVGEGGKVWYRHIDKLPRALRPLQLLGLNTSGGAADGWNVLFVPCDLTYALNGAPASDPVGLSPDSATQLVQAILKLKAK